MFLGRVPAILLVGLAFGLAHGLVEALLVLVPFGIALAVLRDRTDSVYPGMLVHGLFNGIALAACDGLSDVSTLLEIRSAVTRLGENASLVIQRCPTELKGSIDVWGDVGSSLALMRALKYKLDPKNTLNPGRYVGGI